MTNQYNFNEFEKNRNELSEPRLLAEASRILAEHPRPAILPATTVDLKNITKTAHYALDDSVAAENGARFDSTLWARAFAYCKEISRRVETGVCKKEGLRAESRQAGIMRSHALSHGSTFILKIVDKTEDISEKVQLLELSYQDICTAIELGIRHYDEQKVFSDHVQAGNILNRLSQLGNPVSYIQKSIDHKITAAKGFAMYNREMASLMYVHAATLQFDLFTHEQSDDKKRTLLKAAYKNIENSFEFSDDFEHPGIASRYVLRADIDKFMIDLTNGEDKKDWMFKSIYDLLCAADRKVKIDSISAARHYGLAANTWYALAIGSSGNKADEIEFSTNAIKAAEQSLELSLGIDKKHSAIETFHIGNFSRFLYNKTDDMQDCRKARTHFQSALDYFTENPQDDERNFAERAKKAIRWLRSCTKKKQGRKPNRTFNSKPKVDAEKMIEDQLES